MLGCTTNDHGMLAERFKYRFPVGIARHAITTEEWRYIQRMDGTEELYDLTADQSEWTNLAARPELKDTKTELAARIPTTEAEPI